MTAARLDVALVWHMHQPYYRDDVAGEFVLPWVRRRATKDYLPMLAILERHPSIRVTMNLVPSLLLQLELYGGDDVADADRSLCLRPADELTPAEARFLVESALRTDYGRRVAALAPLTALLDSLRSRSADSAAVDELRDLQVWSLLGWIDPELIAADPVLAALAERGRRFREEDKRLVDARQLELVRAVVPRFRAAVARRQVEPMTSPLHHPILPLLIDQASARVASAGIEMPKPPLAAADDAAAQVRRGLDEFARITGTVAAGMWPPECAVSPAAAQLMHENGLRFAISDEGVLARTLRGGGVADVRGSGELYRPHRDRSGLTLLFRDAQLSNLIGFSYQAMAVDDAAADLVARLEAVADSSDEPGRLVTIALDGENFRDLYEENGNPFLDALYTRLAASQRLTAVTVGDHLDRAERPAAALPELWSGSWIDANFTTWIGDSAHTRAWELLAGAHRALADAGSAAGGPAHDELLIAEGSDWFWWFGDHHDSGSDEAWDELFRTHLRNAYRLAGLTVPEGVDEPLLSSAGFGGDCDPLRSIDPARLGASEWAAAGVATVGAVFGSMRPPASSVSRILYGAGGGRLHLRFGDTAPRFDRAEVDAGAIGTLVLTQPTRTLSVVAPVGQRLDVRVSLSEPGRGLERVPARGRLSLVVTDSAPLRVAIVAAECAPLAVGGDVAEVVADTARAAAALGHDVVVLLPLHRGASPGAAPGLRLAQLTGHPGFATGPTRVLQGRLPGSTIPVLSIDAPALFDRASIYGETDDGARYLGFGRLALAVLADTCFEADIVHGFEWQSAGLLALAAADPQGPATVLTLQPDAPGHRVQPATAAAAGLAPDENDLDLLAVARHAADRVDVMPRPVPLAELYATALGSRQTPTV